MDNLKEFEEEVEERTWVINGFKTFSIVAQEYFPEYANSDAASKRMRNEIESDKLLFKEMQAAHYVPNNTPIQPTPPELDAKPLDKVKESKERRKGRELER